jgi:hypothetical protein
MDKTNKNFISLCNTTDTSAHVSNAVKKTKSHHHPNKQEQLFVMVVKTLSQNSKTYLNLYRSSWL